jgi:hypothetical protein
MSSFRTSRKLFTNSLDGDEKTNLPLLKEFPSRTITKKVAGLKRGYKIKEKFQLKEKRRKIQ